MRSSQQIANFLAGAFRNQHSLTPVSYGVDRSTGYIAGYLSGIPRHYAVLLSLKKGDDGVWKPYGRAEAQVFLNEVLPAAPDIPIQIAHLAGAGPGLDAGSKEALAVFADAVSAADPRTRNLYFDLTTNVTMQTSAEDAKLIAARLRQIGLKQNYCGQRRPLHALSRIGPDKSTSSPEQRRAASRLRKNRRWRSFGP